MQSEEKARPTVPPINTDVAGYGKVADPPLTGRGTWKRRPSQVRRGSQLGGLVPEGVAVRRMSSSGGAGMPSSPISPQTAPPRRASPHMPPVSPMAPQGPRFLGRGFSRQVSELLATPDSDDSETDADIDEDEPPGRSDSVLSVARISAQAQGRRDSIDAEDKENSASKQQKHLKQDEAPRYVVIDIIEEYRKNETATEQEAKLFAVRNARNLQHCVQAIADVASRSHDKFAKKQAHHRAAEFEGTRQHKSDAHLQRAETEVRRTAAKLRRERRLSIDARLHIDADVGSQEVSKETFPTTLPGAAVDYPRRGCRSKQNSSESATLARGCATVAGQRSKKSSFTASGADDSRSSSQESRGRRSKSSSWLAADVGESNVPTARCGSSRMAEVSSDSPSVRGDTASGQVVCQAEPFGIGRHISTASTKGTSTTTVTPFPSMFTPPSSSSSSPQPSVQLPPDKDGFCQSRSVSSQGRGARSRLLEAGDSLNVLGKMSVASMGRQDSSNYSDSDGEEGAAGAPRSELRVPSWRGPRSRLRVLEKRSVLDQFGAQEVDDGPNKPVLSRSIDSVALASPSGKESLGESQSDSDESDDVMEALRNFGGDDPVPSSTMHLPPRLTNADCALNHNQKAGDALEITSKGQRDAAQDSGKTGRRRSWMKRKLPEIPRLRYKLRDQSTILGGGSEPMQRALESANRRTLHNGVKHDAYAFDTEGWELRRCTIKRIHLQVAKQLGLNSEDWDPKLVYKMTKAHLQDAANLKFERRRHAAARMLQRRWRSLHVWRATRDLLASRRKAVTCIKRWWSPKVRYQLPVAQKIARRPRLNSMAVKIQAHVRGLLIRRKLRKKRELFSVHWRMHVLHSVLLGGRELAASKIQAIVRMYFAYRKYKTQLEERRQKRIREAEARKAAEEEEKRRAEEKRRQLLMGNRRRAVMYGAQRKSLTVRASKTAPYDIRNELYSKLGSVRALRAGAEGSVRQLAYPIVFPKGPLSTVRRGAGEPKEAPAPLGKRLRPIRPLRGSVQRMAGLQRKVRQCSEREEDSNSESCCSEKSGVTGSKERVSIYVSEGETGGQVRRRGRPEHLADTYYL